MKGSVMQKLSGVVVVYFILELKWVTLLSADHIFKALSLPH
jgi:hypothetical protein